ncbi:MAG: AbrB/MazE/SpoVT family DNA-binding domain-containing protein [Clostridia bacterium]|nr:AbrB/MazE/SpoVT family DNA-binding domain-containing protein [Clostridia bacterium]
MGAIVQKWGNSQGIRIPKYILEEVGLKINDEVEFENSDGKIIIKKAKRNYMTLKDRLEEFYHKPIYEIKNEENEDEVDWGETEGEENI